jgi:hypothetical protein
MEHNMAYILTSWIYDNSLPVCDTMWYRKHAQTFRRKSLSSSSGEEIAVLTFITIRPSHPKLHLSAGCLTYSSTHKLKILRSSETSVEVYRIARCHIPQYNIYTDTDRCENIFPSVLTSYENNQEILCNIFINCEISVAGTHSEWAYLHVIVYVELRYGHSSEQSIIGHIVGKINEMMLTLLPDNQR